VPISAAIAGSEVAITVESMFSMNKATATISGTILLESMGGTSAGGEQGGQGNRIRSLPGKAGGTGIVPA
jgi:hypothetical protein